MQAAHYQRSSSLARKFLDDFPSVKEVPLQLPPEQLAAFESHIRPLLDLAESGSPAVPDKLLAPALRLLVTLMEDDPDDAYAVLRGVADYVQCTFAQCAVDAAGAWALDSDRAGFKAALVDGHAGAPSPDDALLEEMRCRLVAAGMGDLSAPLARSLRAWQPSTGTAGGEGQGGPGTSAGVVPLFAHLAQAHAAREGAFISGPGSRPAWPALRRALAAAGAHYLEPVLGGDRGDRAAGSVVLTGASLIAAMLGVTPHPATLASTQPCPALPDPSAPTRWFDLALVGVEGGPGAADRTVEGCMQEILTRHKMRHADTPVLAADGRPLRSLLLLTKRSLVVLLPEPSRAPASEAAAPHDVGVRVRLLLARNTESLLLPRPLPPPVADPAPEAEASARGGAPLPTSPVTPVDEWGETAAYDGEDVWVLPSALRALLVGRHPIDPLRLHAVAAETVRVASGGADPEPPAVVATAASLVRALALRGWQPEALMPAWGGGDGGASGGEDGDERQAQELGVGALRALALASGKDKVATVAGMPVPGSDAHRDLPAAEEAALLAACVDGLAAPPAAVRAVLAPAGNAAGGGGTAGAAAHARELQGLLRERHGWLWAEVGPDGPGALPEVIAEALKQRLHAPATPLPPEPLQPAPEEAWFYVFAPSHEVLPSHMEAAVLASAL